LQSSEATLGSRTIAYFLTFRNRKLIDKESFLAFSIALALAVTGIVSILASDDLLACFVAGNVFAWEYVLWHRLVVMAPHGRLNAIH